MRAIFNRLRRLEQAAVPDERAHAAAEAILEARRHRLGADYVEPIPFPPESYAGCRSMADRIIRTRELLMGARSTSGYPAWAECARDRAVPPRQWRQDLRAAPGR